MKIFVILLSMTLFFSISCSKHTGNDDLSTKEHKISKYVCPMHPQISSDKPGKCSICGMDMVPFGSDEEEEDVHVGHNQLNEEENVNKDSEIKSPDSDTSMENMKMKPHGRASIKLKLDKQQMIGVTTEVAQKKDLFKTVSAPGRIAFDPELYTAQSEYLEAIRQWNKVKDSPLKEVRRSTSEMIQSSKVRLQVMGLSTEDIKIIAEKGRVTESLIVGNGKGENLIYADVFEADLFNIKPGQSVKVAGSFLGGELLKGEVVSVDQVIDPKTRTGKVRIKIDKTKASIRPEAFVNVSISVPLGNVLVVSLESVLDTGRDLFVFVKKGKGQFEPRKITKLFETDEYMAVLTGLDENEIVVTSGNFMLDSESRLKAVIKKAGQNSQGHNH